MPGMLNSARESWGCGLLFSEGHTEKPRLWDVFFPGLHHDPVQHSTCCLDSYTEAENCIPQMLKERTAAGGGQLWNAWVYLLEGVVTVCTDDLRTDKDMGNFWVWFWLIACNKRQVLSLLGKQNSEQECSYHPQSWNAVSKTLFPSTPSVGSWTKIPHAWALVCSGKEDCFYFFLTFLNYWYFFSFDQKSIYFYILYNFY